MLVLLYLGALAERCIGKWRFFGCIFNQWHWRKCGICLVVCASGDLLVATAGASGAIFGIAGLFTMYCFIVKRSF